MKRVIDLMIIFSLLVVGNCLHRNRLVDYLNKATDDGYVFRYRTDDGQFREERGEIVNAGADQVLRVTGKYSYYGPDGKLYESTYSANENGYTSKYKSSVITAPKGPGILRISTALLSSLAGGGIG
ncbi:larval cuticle protein LCP-30-like [Cylas formicarius]|uniref:larval cuticle protein LCP-30-like n=1 Tax=Cylas formicarius TaxID=197179 RepID=UPI002958A1B0|nr:larval cuticle protein LCP-30-like [Cylas formicarius]